LAQDLLRFAAPAGALRECPLHGIDGRMYMSVTDERLSEKPQDKDEYAAYSALHMGPLVRTLILFTTAGYAGWLLISGLVTRSHLSVALRLSPARVSLPIAVIVGRTRHPLILSLLMLTSLLMLEIGINLSGLGVVGGLPWVIPDSLLVPLALAAIWSWRWDFHAALVISAFGPLPCC
jgi:hypothetical protein